MARSTCPADEVLAQLLRDSQVESASSSLEEHLSVCADCRQRLEEMAGGLTSLGRASDSAKNDSSALDGVIQQLKKKTGAIAAEATRAETPQWLKLIAQVNNPTTSDSNVANPLQLKLGSRYEVLEVIKAGGMGIVFRGIDLTLDRVVAIKLVTAQAACGNSIERFYREARAMAAVKHDHIVTIHSVETEEGLPFLVMEYIDGISLSDRVQNCGKLNFDEVVQLGQEMAAALECAHDVGLVHRDLKPGNVLLENDTGRAKVTDFGLAKFSTDSALTRTGVVVGTPEFMSPEQAIGDPTDARSDLFSLGSVLYTACTGHSPFQATTDWQVIQRIQNETLSPLSARYKDVEPWFSDIVQQLLHKDPERRIQSAAEVRQYLVERRSPQLPESNRAHGDTTRKATVPAPLLRWRNMVLTTVGLLIAALIGLVAVDIQRGVRRDGVAPAGSSNINAFQEERSGAFVVVGQATRFNDIAAAVAAAKNDDVIEICSNGPFVVPPLEIRRRLTIRGAKGTAPVLVSDGVSSSPMIVARADLGITGISVRWEIASGSREKGKQNNRYVVCVEDADLRMNTCRIECRTETANRYGRFGAVRIRRGSAALQDSEILAEDGTSLFLHALPNRHCEITNCVLAGRVGVHLNSARSNNSARGPRVTVQGTSIHAEKAVQLMPLAPASRRSSFTTIVAKENIFDAPKLCIIVLSAQVVNTRSGVEPPTCSEIAQRYYQWREANNVYRHDATLMASVTASRPFSPLPNSVNDQDQWNATWGLGKTGSVRAQIQNQNQIQNPTLSETADNSQPRIVSIRPISGQLPEGVGCNYARIGPSPFP